MSNSYSRVDAISLAAMIYIGISIIYIFLEIYFNLALVHEFSVESSTDSLNTIEFKGKLLTGLGIGLLILKNNIGAVEAEVNLEKMPLFLAGLGLAGIFFSFVLNYLLVNGIVAMGSNEDKAKALLITQLNNTIVPFYNNPEDGKDGKDGKISKEEYFNASRLCIEQGYGAQVYNTLNKLSYSYQKLNKPFKEKEYLDIATDFQKCLIQKTLSTVFPDRSFDEIPDKNKIKEDLYKEYVKMDEKFNEAVAEYNKLKNSKNDYYGMKSRRMAQKIKSEWKIASRKLFGSRSAVSPNLTKEKLYKHKDFISTVKSFPDREYAKKQYKLEIEHFHNRSIDKVFYSYEAHRKYINGIKERTDQFSPDETEDTAKQAKTAYKSIIIPQVILGLSIFFLILNIISLSMFILEIAFNSTINIGNQYKSFSIIPSLIIITCVIFYPSVMNKTAIQNSKPVINTIYYYESLLLKLTSKHKK